MSPHKQHSISHIIIAVILSQCGLVSSWIYAGDSSIRITDILPHRGGAAEYPQSTLHAYLQNLKDGTSINVDVRKTGGDPVDIVVIHDQTTKRTCDKDYIVADKEVSELQSLDAAYWFDPLNDKSYPLRGRGITIPTLDELLDHIKRKKKPGTIIWIDTKDDENYAFLENQKMYDRLIELIDKYDLWQDAYIEVGGIKEAQSLFKREPRIKMGCWSKTSDIKEILEYPYISRIGTAPIFAPIVADQIHNAGKKYHANNRRYSKAAIDELLPYSPDCLGTDHYTELINILDVNAYPSLEIKALSDSQVYATGQNIEFKINVYDANGPEDIQRVEFYVEDKLMFLDADSRSEYTFWWNNPDPGQKWITAIVYDHEGFSGEGRILIQTGSLKTYR